MRAGCSDFKIGLVVTNTPLRASYSALFLSHGIQVQALNTDLSDEIPEDIDAVLISLRTAEDDIFAAQKALKKLDVERVIIIQNETPTRRSNPYDSLRDVEAADIVIMRQPARANHIVSVIAAWAEEPYT